MNVKKMDVLNSDLIIVIHISDQNPSLYLFQLQTVDFSLCLFDRILFLFLPFHYLTLFHHSSFLYISLKWRSLVKKKIQNRINHLLTM